MKCHNALVAVIEAQIDREADVPIHEQVAVQTLLQIGSGASRLGVSSPQCDSARRIG